MLYLSLFPFSSGKAELCVLVPGAQRYLPFGSVIWVSAGKQELIISECSFISGNGAYANKPSSCYDALVLGLSGPFPFRIFLNMSCRVGCAPFIHALLLYGKSSLSTVGFIYQFHVKSCLCALFNILIKAYLGSS